MTNKYGLTFEGNIRVFTKEKEIKGANKAVYKVTDVWFNVSEQEENGQYFNRSMNLIFKRDAEKPESNKIIHVKGFPIITGNGEYRRIALFVQEWGYTE